MMCENNEKMYKMAETNIWNGRNIYKSCFTVYSQKEVNSLILNHRMDKKSYLENYSNSMSNDAAMLEKRPNPKKIIQFPKKHFIEF